jgi:hypothetical protein
MVHVLNTFEKNFERIHSGKKRFEMRPNDKNYQEGDELMIKEVVSLSFHGAEQAVATYTGRIFHCRVDYILNGPRYGVERGHCIMSITKM